MAKPPPDIRVLLLADSHLGFDHPLRPRIARRRRGHDFLANHRQACQAAIEKRVDALVHGGDVFHRPNIPASLVYQAFQPLKEVANAGIPVFVVPGNHERSRIPFDGLACHPGVHVFREPGTVRLTLAGAEVAVSGIPCIRRDVRTRFPEALHQTGWQEREAQLRLLVTHQAFEGAVVGPVDFTFRHGHDVVKLADVPAGFAAVLSGHIHRSQVLETDLREQPCPAPVFYPGSVERTAFAERDEAKGFMTIQMAPNSAGGSISSWAFCDLGARPMEIRPLRVQGLSVRALEKELRTVLDEVPSDAVLRLEADGPPAAGAEKVLAAGGLRRLAPESMNVDVVIPGLRRSGRRRRDASRSNAGRPSRSAPAGSGSSGGSGGDGTPAGGSEPVQGDLF
jgi:DNA repair exonuclease SbcCD nuclease subunit